MCSAFRTFQGWTALSDMAHDQGVLFTVPIPEAMAYLMLRPLLSDVPEDDMCGVTVNQVYPVSEKWHPLLVRAFSGIPDIQAGDSVWWHCDVIHGVAPVENQQGWGNVMYIPAAPWCPRNEEYAPKVREAFLNGESPSDFPEEHYERSWPDRFQPEQLNETGRRGLGIVVRPSPPGFREHDPEHHRLGLAEVVPSRICSLAATSTSPWRIAGVWSATLTWTRPLATPTIAVPGGVAGASAVSRASRCTRSTNTSEPAPPSSVSVRRSRARDRRSGARAGRPRRRLRAAGRRSSRPGRRSASPASPARAALGALGLRDGARRHAGEVTQIVLAQLARARTAAASPPRGNLGEARTGRPACSCQWRTEPRTVPLRPSALTTRTLRSSTCSMQCATA